MGNLESGTGRFLQGQEEGQSQQQQLQQQQQMGREEAEKVPQYRREE